MKNLLKSTVLRKGSRKAVCEALVLCHKNKHDGVILSGGNHVISQRDRYDAVTIHSPSCVVVPIQFALKLYGAVNSMSSVEEDRPLFRLMSEAAESRGIPIEFDPALRIKEKPRHSIADYANESAIDVSTLRGDKGAFLKGEVVEGCPTESHYGAGVVRECSTNSLSVDGAVVAMDHGVLPDLEPLLVTWTYHTGGKPISVYCDAIVEAEVERLKGVYDMPEVRAFPTLTPESLAEAKAELKNLTNQDDYWKPDVIMWKLKALKQEVERVGDKGVLLLDSDIVFCDDPSETFTDCDAVLSPFYWDDPFKKITDVYDGKRKCIVERDGFYNAGYFLTSNPDLVEFWIDLYREGVGGFYEQWCMGKIPQRYRTQVFSTLHNHGIWRASEPPGNIKSVHIHQITPRFTRDNDSIHRVAGLSFSKAREAISL